MEAKSFNEASQLQNSEVQEVESSLDDQAAVLAPPAEIYSTGPGLIQLILLLFMYHPTYSPLLWLIIVSGAVWHRMLLYSDVVAWNLTFTTIYIKIYTVHIYMYKPWVHVCTISLIIYHESISIPWVFFKSMLSFLYHEKYSFKIYRNTNNKNKEIQISELQKYNLQIYRNTNYRNTK